MIELNGVAQVFGGGALGPVLVELVKLTSWHDKRKIGVRYKRLSYWIATLAVLIVAGVVTVIHGVEQVPLLRAVQLGISAPLLVAAWANGSLAKKSERARGAERLLPEMPHESDRSFILRMATLLSW